MPDNHGARWTGPSQVDAENHGAWDPDDGADDARVRAYAVGRSIAAAELAELRDEVDQQRIRAEAAEADAEELRMELTSKDAMIARYLQLLAAAGPKDPTVHEALDGEVPDGN